MSPARTTVLALAVFALAAASGCGGSKKAHATTVAVPVAPTTTTAGGTTGEANQANTRAFPVANVKIADGKPLTHRQWVGKAEAICGHFGRELKSLKIKGWAELPRVLPQETAYLRDEVAQLAKLTPPAANKDDWQQIVNTTLELAEGGVRLGEVKDAGARILETPTGMAFIATLKHLGKIATRNNLPYCATQ
jgi:hypothetical protein